MNIKGILTAAVMAAMGMATQAAAQIEIKFGHVGEPGSLFALSAESLPRPPTPSSATRPRSWSMARASSAATPMLEEAPARHRRSGAALDGDDLGRAGIRRVRDALSGARTASHAARIAKDIIRPMLGPIVAKKGFRIIGVWENGYRQITNNKRPIVKPADLKGIKLRTPKGEWRVKMFRLYGANPSPMALNEVFVALQTGVMDGQENPLFKSTRRSSRKCRSTCRSPGTSIRRPM